MLTLKEINTYIFGKMPTINLLNAAATDHENLLLKEKFAPVLNGKKNVAFRYLLRTLSLTALERLLYDDATVQIESPTKKFPDEEEIKAEFIKLNDEIHHFFPSQFANNKQFAIYVKIFKVFYFVKQYIEDKNRYDAKYLAAINAYKILVVLSELDNNNVSIQKIDWTRYQDLFLDKAWLKCDITQLIEAVKKQGSLFLSYLELLKKHDLLNEKMFKQALDMTEDTRMVFVDYVEGAQLLLAHAQAVAMEFDANAYLNLLAKNRWEAKKLAKQLINLHQLGQLQPEDEAIIFKNAHAAVSICKGLKYLNRIGLFERYELLFLTKPEEVGAYAKALYNLKQEHVFCSLSEKVILGVQKNYLDKITVNIVPIVKQGLLNENTAELFIKHPYFSAELAKAFILLKEDNIVFNKKNITFIQKFMEYNDGYFGGALPTIAQGLVELAKHGALYDETRALLLKIQWSDEIKPLFSAILDLQQAKMLNLQSIAVLEANVMHAKERSAALISLARKDLLSDAMYKKFQQFPFISKKSARQLIYFADICDLNKAQRESIVKEPKKLSELWFGIEKLLQKKKEMNKQDAMRLFNNIDIASYVADLINSDIPEFDENIKLLAQAPEQIATTTRSLLRLNKHHYLDDTVRSFIAQHIELSKEISRAVTILHDAGKLDQANWHLFMTFQQEALDFAIDISRVVDLMHQAQIATPGNKAFLGKDLNYLAEIELAINQIIALKGDNKKLFYLVSLKPQAINETLALFNELKKEDLLTDYSLQLLTDNFSVATQIVADLIKLKQENIERVNEFQEAVANLKFTNDNNGEKQKKILKDLMLFFKSHSGMPATQIIAAWENEYQKFYLQEPLSTLKELALKNKDNFKLFKNDINYDKLFSILTMDKQSALDNKVVFRKHFY